jgi:hypothetical protein
MVTPPARMPCACGLQAVHAEPAANLSLFFCGGGRLADLLADEVEADGEERDALEEQEVEVQPLLGEQAPRGGREEEARKRELLLEDPVWRLLGLAALLGRGRGRGGSQSRGGVLLVGPLGGLLLPQPAPLLEAALGDAAHELGRRRRRVGVGVGLGEREDVGGRRGAARLLGDDPLVGAAQLEQPGHHGVELGDGHGVLEEQVGDDEREGLGRRQDVEDGHEHGDVADDPDGQLRFRHEHGERQDHAEEREGVEGQHQLPQQEEEHHQVRLLPERDLYVCARACIRSFPLINGSGSAHIHPC